MGIIEIGNQVINLFKLFTPVITVIIAVLFAAGLIRWGKRVGFSIKEITSNPASFLFGILIIALFAYLYFKHIAPLFDKL